MPFSHRVFCRDFASPSLSEVMVWLRQNGHPVTIAGGPPLGDLLSNFWEEVHFSIADDQPALLVRCLRADPGGVARLRAEVDDFIADVRDLPEAPPRFRVLQHLAATRSLVVIEFPAEGGPVGLTDMAQALATLFVERAGGLAQRDGLGFVDEDDDVMLGIG